MAENSRQLDPIEEALVELDAGERAGLFTRTGVSAQALLAASVPAGRVHPRWLSPRFMLPVAAAVALAVGVSAWKFNSSINALRNAGPAGGVVAVVDAFPCDGGFYRCLTGPGAIGATRCRIYDYDSDGDVDLADFRSYQVTCAGPSR